MLKIFKSQANFDWKELNSFSQIEAQTLIKNHEGKSVFATSKHSTICSISSIAKRRIELEWNKLIAQFLFFYFDLIRNRHLSNKIAEHFEVKHKSPQLLLIQNGEALFNSSHLSINCKELSNYYN